jgi:hypothetical protein
MYPGATTALSRNGPLMADFNGIPNPFVVLQSLQI